MLPSSLSRKAPLTGKEPLDQCCRLSIAIVPVRFMYLVAPSGYLRRGYFSASVSSVPLCPSYPSVHPNGLLPTNHPLGDRGWFLVLLSGVSLVCCPCRNKLRTLSSTPSNTITSNLFCLSPIRDSEHLSRPVQARRGTYCDVNGAIYGECICIYT
jgi:hypothetical protein